MISKKKNKLLMRIAHKLVTSAISTGKLIPKPCENCGTEVYRYGRVYVLAHHDDYNESLKIKWICRKCHRKYHSLKLKVEEKD